MGLGDAQQFLQEAGVDGWLLYDYRGSNPYLQEVMGRRSTTRRVFLFVPRVGEPTLLVHHVDAGRFADARVPRRSYLSRQELHQALGACLQGCQRVAMEYSPLGALPSASHVDGGTLEMVRQLGVEVISSADLFQYAFARWSPADLESHARSAARLVSIVQQAFAFIGGKLGQVTELEAVQFIRQEMTRAGLETEEGPVVACREHSSDPHFEPAAAGSYTIAAGDWVLIDLWAAEPGQVYADLTWVGFAGKVVPTAYREVFTVVAGARDRAFDYLEGAWSRREPVAGWQVDQVARDHITRLGYGNHFTHRLGHSLGRRVHGFGANLDNFETQDTRRLVPGLAFTLEPGVYLPEFGVRTEADAFMGPDGPELTTEVQREIVIIGE